MDKKKYRDIKVWNQIDSRSNNVYIHGFLHAVQNYVVRFGLESTAAFILASSGICEADLIRCQIEDGYETERMLLIIKKELEKKLLN